MHGDLQIAKKGKSPFQIFGRTEKIAPGLLLHCCRFAVSYAGDEEEVIEIFGGCFLPHTCGGKNPLPKAGSDARIQRKGSRTIFE